MSTFAASKKALERRLTNLRDCMAAGNIVGIRTILLEDNSSEFFTRIREQKLLFRVPTEERSSVAILLRSAASALGPEVRPDFEAYVEFALRISLARDRCVTHLHAELKRLPTCQVADLVGACDEVFDWYMKRLVKGGDVYSSGASVAVRELRLHDLNGAMNDLVMAIARVVNESARVAPTTEAVTLPRSQRRRLLQVLRRAVPMAGDANSLEWMCDSVTYGELKVGKEIVGVQPTFRLDFVDERRYLLKSLAIRRRLVLVFTGHRNRRWIREQLKALESPVLEQAITHYRHLAGSSAVVQVDLSGAYRMSTAMLSELDAEDDLLIAASGTELRAQTYYVVAMMMRWYCAAAVALGQGQQGTDCRAKSMTQIPLDEITRTLKGPQSDVLSDAIENLTVRLPARNHTCLVDRPFVRDGPDQARPFLRGGVGSWTSVVREALIQGGSVGKRVGAVWEDYAARSFEGSDWLVVGRGVKLRRDGQILTDADLLLLREDLLLVMQIKGLTGLGNCPYDHWRNRQSVEFGCKQARIATDFFASEPSALVSFCGKRKSRGIRHIQPVVLTNISQLDGWRVHDVPVIGEVTRKAICQGARVDYYDQCDQVIHTHHIVKPEELTTESILGLLHQSQTIEMKIAAEGSEIRHVARDIGGLTLLMPEFVIRADANDPPSHEPKIP